MPTFFPASAKSHCAHHAWGEKEKGIQRYGFRAWKILKIFLQFFFSASRLSATPLRVMESFARFCAGGELEHVGRVGMLGGGSLLLYFQFHLYLFFCTNILFCSIVMYTTGLGCFFWSARRMKSEPSEIYCRHRSVCLKVFDTFVEILWRLWEIDFNRIRWKLCDWITDRIVDSLKRLCRYFC